MIDKAENNKRLAKNVVFLYIRMLLLMIVSFYTSRVVLHQLGVVDYGLYNVVGGVVVIFSFLSTSMANATQRYLNYDLATNDTERANKTFNTCLIIHFAIAALIVLFSETIGLWLFYKKMDIPADRYPAAMWVFQCSILTMAITTISIPYNAAIIAHEKMSAFAYISILEAGLKLAVALLLPFLFFDKLIVYAVLLFLISVFLRFVYSTYSNKHFEETHFHFVWDMGQMKEIGSFAVWSLIGNLALAGVTQGVNIVLNIFFGPVVNAARGVAVQVQGAIQQLSQNFQVAINPQITKSYATNESAYLHSLVCKSSKYSFFLVFFISLPIVLMVDQLLGYWLVEVPEHSSSFLIWIIGSTLVNCLSNSLNVAVEATGTIRKFQLTSGTILLMVVPVSYLILKYVKIPEIVFIVQFVIMIIIHIVKLVFAHKKVNLSYSFYVKQVYLKIGLVLFISPIVPTIAYYSIKQSLLSFLLTGFLCVISTLSAVYYVGLDKGEREFVNHKITRLTHRSVKK